MRGSVVRILDDRGAELPRGETGRIFVGNLTQFEGYTGGGSKEQVRGLMASGDVGHFDEHDRLFVEGRDDEMIVSGGENVFPAEVEELLARHDAIAEAAVIGVDDERFGQGLKAFVVTRPGASLSEDEVKDYVGDNLARYKTPRRVVFIDSLPAQPDRQGRQARAGRARGGRGRRERGRGRDVKRPYTGRFTSRRRPSPRAQRPKRTMER